MLYSLLRPIIGVALTWYYRAIAISGKERIPARGPVFLAVNHPNALVDALVVAWSVPRRVHFTAKATIFSNPIVAAFLRAVGVVPLRRVSDELKKAATPNAGEVVAIDPARNAESFRAVAEALRAGHAVVIFPEGKSHDEPQLAPLKTGLARMALMSRDTFGVRGIRIVPLGLLFERKEEPRSRVLVQVGEAIDVDSFTSEHDEVDAMTALVASRLAQVTINFETADDARRISTVSETLAALIDPLASVGDAGPPLASVMALVRRAERVRRALEFSSDSELGARSAEFERRMAAFRARLSTEHIAAGDVHISLDATSGARFAIREAVLAALYFPITLWGRITHFVPIRLARFLALKDAKNRDEPAMNTLLFGVALVLVSYALETTLVWMLAGAWWALAFFLTLIPSASSDLRYGDRARRRTQRMRTYFRFRRNAALQPSLEAEAKWLRSEAVVIEQSLPETAA